MTTATATAPCELCDGLGWQFVTVDGVRRSFRCECFRSRLLTPPGLPMPFENATLENYQIVAGNRNSVEAARKWLDSGRGDLLITGDFGTGKTRLAASLLNDHFRQVRSGAFVQSVAYIKALQKSFDSTITDEERRTLNVLERDLKTAQLVVIDDLGREKASEFTRRELFLLYEARWGAGLRTIWTSNYEPAWFDSEEGFNDPRLASRLLGRALQIELTCGDWRAKGTRELRG